MLVARRAEAGNFACLLAITPLTSTVRDQRIEIESLNLFGCYLTEKLDILEDIEEGKFDIVYTSPESAKDKQFLQSLNNNNNLYLCSLIYKKLE